jgi:hypothetical protein
MTDYGLGDHSSTPAQRQGIFFSPRVQTGPEAHPVSCPMGTEGPFPGGKADHSPPSSVEVKKEWSYTFTTPYVVMAWYDFTLPSLAITLYYNIRASSSHSPTWNTLIDLKFK